MTVMSGSTRFKGMGVMEDIPELATATSAPVPACETDLLLPSADPAMLDEDDDANEDNDGSSDMFARLKQNLTKSIRNSVGDILSLRDSIGPQAIMQEISNVGHAFQDHLAEADEGKDFFLDMNLARNLSILPSKPEIQQAVEEVEDALAGITRTIGGAVLSSSVRRRKMDKQETPVVSGSPKDSTTSNATKTPLSAYLTLASAVVALSSIGPFLAKQKNVNGALKIVWRFQGTAMLLGPLAIRNIIVDGMPRLSILQWWTFLCASASYAVLCVAFALSINYTSVANATVLTNSQSVLLVAAKIFVGQQVVFLEGFGVLVAFFGAVLCARESATLEDTPSSGWLNLWGDALGLISSIGGIGYIVLGKALRASMPVLIFMTLNMLLASFLILLYMKLAGLEFSWNRHIDHGVFGWMNLAGDRLPLEIATVVVCNLMGTMGYVRAFAYFSSVVIAVAALLEPVVAAFTAVALGVGVLPGVEGWIGNLLVILGTIAVLWPTYQEDMVPKQPTKQSVKPSSAKQQRSPYPRMKSPRFYLPQRDQEGYTDRSLP